MSGEIRLPIVGNLTADPELRYTQGGLAVANFTIASTPREVDRQTGQPKDGAPVFMRASVWRDFAEHVAHSLRKGTRVVAFGVLRERRWEDADGNKRTSMELEVEAIGPDLRFAEASVMRSAAPESSRRPADTWPDTSPSAPSTVNYDDETPF